MKLNGWLVVGYIGVGIGVFALVIGLMLGLTAYNAVSGIGYGVGEQLGQTVFLAAFSSWGITGGILVVGGIIALYAGRSVEPNEPQSVTQTVNVSTPYQNEPPIVHAETETPMGASKYHSSEILAGTLPLPKQGVCPSCEYPIVFIEKYDRWYCVNERKYI